jgi:hypothetical protein
MAKLALLLAMMAAAACGAREPVREKNVAEQTRVPIDSAPAGVVNGVRGALVGISLGSADNVKVGDVFSLSRGTQYVGRIVITVVDKNQSVGEFDTWGCANPPVVGDKATLGKPE